MNWRKKVPWIRVFLSQLHFPSLQKLPQTIVNKQQSWKYRRWSVSLQGCKALRIGLDKHSFPVKTVMKEMRVRIQHTIQPPQLNISASTKSFKVLIDQELVFLILRLTVLYDILKIHFWTAPCRSSDAEWARRLFHQHRLSRKGDVQKKYCYHAGENSPIPRWLK